MPHPFLARQTALVFSVHEIFALQSTFLVVPLVLAPAYIGLDTQSPAFYFVHKVSEFLPVLFGDKSTSYHKRVVFIDRSPAECYNSSRVLWIGEKSLP